MNLELELSNPTATWTRRLGLRADWVDMIFVHYAFAPEVLEPHVPLPLDVHGGEAYISLVLFQWRKLRVNGSGPVGRWLCRPFSEHPFLNLRTYVCGPAGAGIYFLAEWISNPVSVHLGPRLYSLPYRYARFAFESDAPGGVDRVHLHSPETNADACIVVPSRPKPFTRSAPATRTHFLLERTTAYAAGGNRLKFFHVEHDPWLSCEPDWVRVDSELMVRAFPWFQEGRLVGAHRSPGVNDVFMSRPYEAGAVTTERSKYFCHKHAPAFRV